MQRNASNLIGLVERRWLHRSFSQHLCFKQKLFLFLAVLLPILKHKLWLNWSRSHYHDHATGLLYKSLTELPNTDYGLLLRRRGPLQPIRMLRNDVS